MIIKGNPNAREFKKDDKSSFPGILIDVPARADDSPYGKVLGRSLSIMIEAGHGLSGGDVISSSGKSYKCVNVEPNATVGFDVIRLQEISND